VNGQPRDFVAEALDPRAVRNAGYFDPVVIGKLMEKCRTGAAIGFADNMAFVTALSTQLLHEEFVAGTQQPQTEVLAARRV
jgi:asparagine synthase (glutamine-hydrolysing)